MCNRGIRGSLIRTSSCIPYPAVSCRILPCSAVSCRILPYCAVSAVSCRLLLFLPFLLANSTFTLEEFVIRISFLQLGHSQISCAMILGIGVDYCIQVLRSRMLWNADGNYTNIGIPNHHHMSAIVDPVTFAPGRAGAVMV